MTLAESPAQIRSLSIRAGRGLGDALYLQSAARWLVRRGKPVEVHSDWPDVFLPLAGKVTVRPFSRVDIDRVCHYTAGKTNNRTTQWQDCCLRAGIPIDTDLRLDWMPLNTDLVAKVREGGKPVALVLIAREPMDRRDRFGRELLPDCRAIQRIIDRLRERGAKIVLVGAGEPLFEFSGIDLDLTNATSVADLIDCAWAADAMLGYVSFFVPLAESLDKPALFVWSRRGVKSDVDYIRTITPPKILHGPKGRAVFDDSTETELTKAADALLATR